MLHILHSGAKNILKQRNRRSQAKTGFKNYAQNKAVSLSREFGHMK